jgi:hypothetical protein
VAFLQQEFATEVGLKIDAEVVAVGLVVEVSQRRAEIVDLLTKE